MNGKYEHIIELIELWDEFETARPTSANGREGGPRKRLEELYSWLGQKIQSSYTTSALKTSLSNDIPSARGAESGGHAPHLPNIDSRISILIGRMARFAKFYVKKAMEDKPLSSLDEFTFLATIHRSGNPTKSEMCQENLTEITTGTEIMRRLIKAGFVEEFTDLNDRRVKRLRITDEGRKALFESFEYMRRISRMVVGTLTPQQKQELMAMLVSLDVFHTNIYNEQKTETLEDLLTRNLPYIADVGAMPSTSSHPNSASYSHTTGVQQSNIMAVN